MKRKTRIRLAAAALVCAGIALAAVTVGALVGAGSAGDCADPAVVAVDFEPEDCDGDAASRVGVESLTRISARGLGPDADD